MAERWRTMRQDDLPDVSRIAGVVHPDFHEDDQVFGERLRLFPQGCFTLVLDGAPSGYLLSHPWHAFDVPQLNSLLGELPPAPETYYLHDIALLPQARSRGQASPIVRHLLALAGQWRLPSVSLVAVNGSPPFWQRFGFEDAGTEELRKKLLSYDAAAQYMMRRF